MEEQKNEIEMEPKSPTPAPSVEKKKKKAKKPTPAPTEIEETPKGDSFLKPMAIGAFLFVVSQGDGPQVLRMLSSGNVGVNDGDYDKRTAMHIAAAEGHFEIVKSLVAAGADINRTDRWGSTPLDEATRHGHDKIAEYLKQLNASHGTSSDFGLSLVNAASKGDLETVQRLVKSGISVQSCDYDKRTPLHVAVANRQLDIIEFLLQNEADINAEDAFGSTPLKEVERVTVRTGDDPVAALLKRYSLSKEEAGDHKTRALLNFKNPFALIVLLWELVFIILFAVFVEYDVNVDGHQGRDVGKAVVTQLYPTYMDVHVMIFIGFGFLMTFLRKYGYTSVGLNFLLAALAIQWYLLVGPFWEKVLEADFSHKIFINIGQLIKADFSAGAVLITFGAILGKATPLQLVAVAFSEIIFYSLNEAVSVKLEIVDLGGSMVIHLFGAYFGLAASRFLTPQGARSNSDNSAVYRSDLFSMIGTIFLWIYWPSFNGAFGEGNTQHRAIVNTLLSLCGSCVTAFACSQLVRGKHEFNMVDIQNATLAGGVAMGSAADLVLHPAISIGLGALAGFVSVFGFTYVQPFLEKKFGIHDTCGVNNLHGMPGIIGAITGMIASAAASMDHYDCRDPNPPEALALQCVDIENEFNGTLFPESGQMFDIFVARPERSASQQGAYQLAFAVITLSIASITGLLTGYLVSKIFPSPKRFFVDDQNWEVPERETPYYFDKRGEIVRDADHQHEHTLVKEIKELESKLKKMESNLKEATEEKKDKKQEAGTAVNTDLAATNATIYLLLQTLANKIDNLAQKQ